jgi:Uma2 family endonuclease
MVVAGELEFLEGRKHTITNPLMIVKVLSKSTRNYDRDEKFAAYRTIPSFGEYLLIEQYTMHVEQYSKTDNNRWIFSEYEDSEQIVSLESIGFQISLIDIYDKVNFNEQE